jgi:hypothetical protein
LQGERNIVYRHQPGLVAAEGVAGPEAFAQIAHFK